MKKLLFIAVSVLISTAAFAQNSAKTKYFFVYGWEYKAYVAGNTPATKAQPAISNVFSTNCKDDDKPMKIGIENEFSDHYAAYLSKNRGFDMLRPLYVYGDFESYEEAEKERRKVIADLNYKSDPIFVKDFSVSCE